MKIFMTILIIIGIIIAIPLIAALFIKNEYAIEREISIQKPRQEVYNYVKLTRNQDYYNKWVMQDPAMKKNFRGTDGTVGFVYAWDGNNQAGKGEQEIKKITEAEKIEMEIRFERPMTSVCQVQMATESVDATMTKVRWGMQGRNKYPMNLMNLFMDNLLGKDLEQSLLNLKGILEKQ